MVAILSYLRIIMDRTTDASVKELVGGVRDLTKDTLEGLRHLAVNLHPPLLDDLGLIVAMEKDLDSFRTAHPQIQITYAHDGDFAAISHPIALLCYRLMQEALTNIIRHSQATTVAISLQITPALLRMSITDNGIGFSEDTAKQARLDNHLGLVSMRERTELLNGTFCIHSQPAAGTAIFITLPLEKDMPAQGGTSHVSTH